MRPREDRSSTLCACPGVPSARHGTVCGAGCAESRKAGVIMAPRTPMPRGVFATCCALVLAAAMPSAPAARDNPVPALVAELGIKEAPQRVDQRAGWRRPRKIIVRATEFPGVEWLQPVAPGVQLIAVDTVEDAIGQARDADAVIGWCDARILAAGQRIRWIQFLSAGVE